MPIQRSWDKASCSSTIYPERDATGQGLQCKAMHIKLIARIVISVAMAFASIGAISLIDKLPYSHPRDVVSDSLKFPAYLIAGVLAPEGIHGSNPILWIYSGIAALYCTYAVFWFTILTFVARRRRTDVRH
jgi:hypothetical protein